MKIAVGLSCVIAALYLLTAGGHLSGQDQEYYYRMARALSREQTFAIEPLVFQNTEIAGRRGRDGRFYAEYAPGLSVVLSPLVWLGDRMTNAKTAFAARYPWLHEDDNDVIPRILVSYFDLPILALCAGMFALLLLRLGYSALIATITAIGFAFATFAWGQARIINPEPLQTLLMLAAALMITRGSTKGAIGAGLAIGLGALVKITTVLAIPALLLLPDPDGRPIWRRPMRGIALLLPAIAGLGVYAWYNYSRFGNASETGYQVTGMVAEINGNGFVSPLAGLVGLLFSPGRGIIWYAPLLLAAIAGTRQLWREKSALALAIAMFASIWVLFYACYRSWDSGWGWGPRYLLPMVPFALIASTATLQSRKGRALWFSLAIVGFVIQLPGALTDFMASGRAGMAVFAQAAQEHSVQGFVHWRNFTWTGSEIVRSAALLVDRQFDLALLTFRGTPLPWIIFGLCGALMTIGLLLLISARPSFSREGQNVSGTTP